MQIANGQRAGSVPFAEVGRTLRVVLGGATAARLSGTHWRVLAAVVTLTASYSKTTDRTYVAKIADLAELDATDPKLKRTKRALKHLASKGLIRYEPARKHGDQTTISICQDSRLGGGKE
jgi:hypothetical protein